MASFNHYFFYKPKWQLKLAIFESLLYSTHYYNRLPVRSIIITVTFVTSSKLDYNKQLFPRLKLAIIMVRFYRNAGPSRHTLSFSAMNTLWKVFWRVPKSPGVNFINIYAHFFCTKVLCAASFSLFTVWLCNFCCKNMSAKAARKMLVKLTTCVNFTNIL